MISIIIPVYKVEKYLEQCIESLLIQTYKDLEIILVDDGSPDNCPVICDMYAKKDFRVKVIHKMNGGLSDARNAGINVATGNYIMFVDGDDFVKETYVELLYQKMIRTNVDIVMCEIDSVDENGMFISHVGAEFSHEIWDYKEFWSQYISYPIVCAVAWNKLYKREVFDNIRYEAGKQHEDEFIIHHIVTPNTRVAVVSESLYFYRQRRDSIMGNGFTVKNLDAVEAFLERSRIMRRNGTDCFAGNSLDAAMCVLVLAKKCLDMNDEHSFIRYKSLRTEYKNELKKWKSYKMKRKRLLVNALFYFNDSIYIWLLNLRENSNFRRKDKLKA